MKQTVGQKKLNPLQGLILVLALAVALILMNQLSLAFLVPLMGDGLASAVFWLLGGALALWVLRTYASRCVYELGPDVLRLGREYGRKLRPIEDIYLRQIVFVGAPEEAKKRWPAARRVRALHARGTEPVLAVAYKTVSGVQLALIQANDELRERLEARVKGK